MIVTETRVETTGNIAFDEDVAMGFDASANAFLVNNLIKQYSDPYLAALREYTSNARDAHAAVGQTRPVEVSLPAPLSPNLIIEDFGVGLSREELKGYGQFGASTKRDSNDYVGGFGLGSKSGLAMASQFSVTSVKDGKRNTVIVRRDESGAPSMGFLAEQDVDASVSNGTRITIPTSERQRFVNAIEKDFFYGWEQGSILIDGKEPPVSVFDTAYWTPVGKAAFRSVKPIQQSYGRGHILKALVGPVAYTLDLSQLSEENVDWRGKEHYLANLILRLDNGSVEIHPSRENLIYDKRTRAAIAARLADVIAEGVAEHQKAIDAAKSPREAVLSMIRAEKEGFKARYSYKGVEMAFKTDIDKDSILGSTIWQSSITHSSRAASGWGSDVFTHTYANIVNSVGTIHRIYQYRSVLVTDVPVPTNQTGRPAELSGAAIWAELDAETAGEDVSPREYDVYFTTLSAKQVAKKLDSFFTNGFEQIVTAEDYKAIVTEERKRRAAETRAANQRHGGGTRATGIRIKKDEVRVLNYRSGGRSTTTNTSVDDLDATATHILVKTGTGYAADYIKRSVMNQRGDRSHNLDSFVDHMIGLGYVFIMANANTNTDKYAAEIPNLIDVKDLGDVLRGEAAKVLDTLTDFDKWLYTKNQSGDHAHYFHSRAYDFSDAHLAQIEDTRIVEFVKSHREFRTKVETKMSSLRIFAAVSNFWSIPQSVFSLGGLSTSYKPDAFDKEYPMLAKHGNYRHPGIPAATVVEYVNLVHTMAQIKKVAP